MDGRLSGFQLRTLRHRFGCGYGVGVEELCFDAVGRSYIVVQAPAMASRTVVARSRSSGSMWEKCVGRAAESTTSARGDIVGRAANAGDGGVGAEVDDPPAAVAQGDSEGDEAEGVKFSRRAGEQRDRSGAAVGAAQQRKQACFQQPAGEVLLADVDFGASPAFAEVVEERQVASR